MSAARALRDAVDAELAMFDPEDELQEVLGGPVDRLDEALTAVSRWLMEPEACDT